MSEVWYGIHQTATLLKLKESTVKTLVSTKRLRATGRGAQTKISAEDVARYDQERRRVRVREISPKIDIPEAPVALGVTQHQIEDVDLERKLSAELAKIDDRITLLQVRKAEIEEVLAAMRVVRRFLELETRDAEKGVQDEPELAPR